MSELRSYKVAPFVVLRDVSCFSDEAIADMLNKADVLGLDLSQDLDLSLADLEILVRDCGEAN